METATDGRDALQRLCAASFDIAILNTRPPNVNGLEILCNVRESRIPTGILLLIDDEDIKTAVHVVREGAQDILSKRLDAETQHGKQAMLRQFIDTGFLFGAVQEPRLT